MKTMNRIILILMGFVVIFFIVMTWFYPFSSFSIHKSYTYSADPVVVKEYAQDLEKFKKLNDLFLKDNLTTNRVQYILHMYEQYWLISKKPTKIGNQELDSILFEVKQARQNLLDLAFKETYHQNQAKDYLRTVIEDSFAIEELIYDIKEANADSRNTLNTKFRNLHMIFINDFNLFVTFYGISQNG